MRGQNTFNTLFQQREPIAGHPKKGRNQNLLEERDILLLFRYFYYARIHKIKYDAVIEALSTEFFISQRRTVDIVTSRSYRLKEITDANPSITKLKEIYPFFNWINPTIKPTICRKIEL